MKLGINAFNISCGGGLTHLAELLSAANPVDSGFSEVIIWSGKNTIMQLPHRDWLTKIVVEELSQHWMHKLYWLFFKFPQQAKQCDVLFVPGGSYFGSFKPFVTMLQNMLPFEPKEAKRFIGISLIKYLKWNALYVTQSFTLRRAAGAIFPSSYSRKVINQAVKGIINVDSMIVPHGINTAFKKASEIKCDHVGSTSVRLLYISIIDPYKHQWQVVKAVGLLRQKGIDVSLDLVGPIGTHKSAVLLKEAMQQVDPEKKIIRYLGEKKYNELPALYAAADIFVFASSCESISSIVLEAMGAGLAIACSSKGAMSEMLADAGVYFDPEKPESIANAISQFIFDQNLRRTCSQKAYERSMKYSWETCATQTFNFIAQVAKKTVNIGR